MSPTPIQIFEQLAQQKYDEVSSFLKALDPYERRALFIEVCRALDYEQVRQMTESDSTKLPYPEFDLMLRGWNTAVAVMLTPDWIGEGIPAKPSTTDTLRVGRSILHEMGLVSLLRKTISMMNHGMAGAVVTGSSIEINSLNFGSADHFLDQIDVGALPRVTLPKNPLASVPLKSTQEIDEEMRTLVFPWDGAPGVTTVGYGASPTIDDYFLSATADQMIDWRNEAGIHPETKLRGISGALLAGVTGLLASIYVKHIRFVTAGYQKLDGISVPVSLTLWEPLSQLIESMTSFIGGGVAKSDVAEALEFLTLHPGDTRFFNATEKPYIPMLIQVSDIHVLRPVSSIFRNPLHGARMALEFNEPDIEAMFREPREAWMRDELNLLFLGTECKVMWKPRIIKHRGQVLTDIDASVYDSATRCLALFQLKWQDFGTADVKKQKSRAKNFVSQVDDWTNKVENWMAEVGLEAVAKALHLEGVVETIRLFAVGRFVARFKSYGYSQASSNVAVCTWPQLARIRDSLPTNLNLVDALYVKIVEERSRLGTVVPIPYQVQIGAFRLVFRNTWNTFQDSSGA